MPASSAVPPSPLVSVVMANYAGEAYLPVAIASVLAQTHGNLELIVVDDASPDASKAVIAAAAKADPRIRAVFLDRNGGPARARNAALDTARGDWIAIVDADDQIHPERFERLLVAASHSGADIVADDLLHFYEDRSPVRFLLPSGWQEPRTISALDWIEGGSRPDMPALGYLKPLFHRTSIGARRYDESVRIGEDYLFVLALLLDAARMLVVPQPWYLYRRHVRSTSHRLSVADLRAMIGADDAVLDGVGAAEEEIHRALGRRRRLLVGKLERQRLIEATKRRDVVGSFGILRSSPSAALAIPQVLAERLRALRKQAPSGKPVLPAIPDYIPPRDYLAARVDRSVWEQLVNTAVATPKALHLEGRAGRYAAGFLPRESKA